MPESSTPTRKGGIVLMDSPNGTVVQRFQDLESSEFGDEIRKLWDAGSKVVDAIVEQVEEGPLLPVQGLAMIGCTVATLYGYQAFHGESSHVDLLSAIRTPEIARRQ